MPKSDKPIKITINYKSGASVDLWVTDFVATTEGAELTKVTWVIADSCPIQPTFIGLTNIESIWRHR